jgi:catechol 2,3-dioxygenase
MGELPAEARLGAVRLRAGDLDVQRDFYERAIGLDTIHEDDGVTVLGMAGGEPLVELVAAPDAPPRPRGTSGLFHLALLTPSRRDLADALRRVLESGWRLSGASDHLVSEALYLSDPEGNGIELYRDRPRDAWPTTDDGLQMATLPLDLEDVLSQASSGPPTPKMGAGSTLGHVHLNVGDLDAAAAFWVDGLGFDVVTRYGPSALFVSAGGYHHHVGLNTWEGVGAPPPPAGARGLEHFEVVLPDAGSVEAAAARLERVASVQRDNGRVRATDPSGNAVVVRT